MHSRYCGELGRIALDVGNVLRKSLCVLEERLFGNLTTDFSTKLGTLPSLLWEPEDLRSNLERPRKKPGVTTRACNPTVEGTEDSWACWLLR